jgi:hypothetical protein
MFPVEAVGLAHQAPGAIALDGEGKGPLGHDGPDASRDPCLAGEEPEDEGTRRHGLALLEDGLVSGFL